MRTLLVSAAAVLCAAWPPADPTHLADTYADAIEDVNADHAQKPGDATEAELAAQVPKKARKALDELLELEPSAEVAAALVTAGEAALELALTDDFGRIRARLVETAPQKAAELGTALAHERFLLRGLGGLDEEYLATLAGVLDAVLDGYDEVFGFDELSKVPGKKLRVRVHLEEKIERPPHFAPQHRWHSEIDFPVVDARELRSPTADGKFLFYGLCHELGHVVAMWGDRSREEDHHAWAHYTGVTIVEHLAKSRGDDAALAGLRDVRWRSLEKLRAELGEREPGFGDNESVLALLVALHDAFGPRAIGDAIDAADAEDERLRINRVRYYTFDALREKLAEELDKSGRKKLAAIWPE